ncbi:bifunctional [glutamine synthetase] adenylyltransferase/[glutamine synthetase]-adenylyl-L-tyrosine phosphorylase, partial [Elioraea rosea]|uniref:bifunctional [glutamine synthetase] adenylyltransferase/[glutamine synthetase]-adenylyl-L-tyrosine phosphorylase n=1 Tax=Elioraea rosea TaxID=2492390 RepID=UPI001185F6FA
MPPIIPPRPHDETAAALWRERWDEAWAERLEESPGAGPNPAGAPAEAALLDAIFGNSPFLAALAVKEQDAMAAMLADGPDAAFSGVLASLAAEAPPDAARADIAAALRRAKRRGALVIGAADIAGTWDVGQVTAALSDLAEATLSAVVRHLLAQHMGQPAGQQRGGGAGGSLRLRHRDDPARGSGLIVLGMGKLGARELNYSSDIDLVVLFDASQAYHGDNPGAFFVRLARELVRLMEERSADGYVFRTDLRLRPDPAATPLAVSVDAAHTYYSSLGQNWERAAMIKARPVAGDLAAGNAFLAELRPFIWRKHLDFAAIRDIHSIKRQIQAHRGGAEIAVAGHNLKLGRGGIREIEFFAQVQQLIWGGRDPKLRNPRTREALAALRRAGLLEDGTEQALARAYDFLRRIEHRLQMQDDRQTHALPEDEAGLAAIATFSGYPDAASFAEALLEELRAVERAYAALFEEAPDLAGPGSLVFTGVTDDPATIATLQGMGYANATAVASAVRAWHHGRPRATRSERARELLTELMPALLASLAKQQDPDAAFTRFDAFLNRLPAGVQIFSLFQRNPALLDRIASVFGAAPLLADHLATHPAALEGLLTGDVPQVDTGLDAALADCRYLEEAMDAVRRVVHERAFLIGAATLDATMDADSAGRARADLADAALAALLPRVAEDFVARHGRIARGAMAAIALGKLGGREMMAASDLDIIMVYDHAPGAEAAKGGTGRALTPPEYFGRLATAFVAAISAPSGAGKLFDVDMRLRPSGNKGPIAVALEGFARYHENEAWTWEHMALTRARPVAGPPALQKRVAAAIRAALTRRRDPDKLRADAAALR